MLPRAGGKVFLGLIVPALSAVPYCLTYGLDGYDVERRGNWETTLFVVLGQEASRNLYAMVGKAH